MKHFYKHPQFKRWGMYSVLLAALGFSVSMNPDHFNNIARYETDFFSADFAATSAPDKIVFEKKTIEGYVSKTNGQTYNVEYSNMGNVRRAKFVLASQADTEAKGADCAVCGVPFDLASDLNVDDQAAITAELDAQFARISKESSDDSSEHEQDVAQDNSKQYLEDWAKPCLGKKDKVEKMECHSTRLIALSTKLEDDSKKGSIVLKYFQKYLKSSLRSAFSSKFYRVRASSSLGGIEEDEKATELNEKANEVYEQIIAELQPENGEKTRKDLWAMYRGAFGKQAEHSLNLLKQGYEAGNMQMFQLGKNSLFALQGELDTLSSVTMDQLADVNSENSMEDLYMSTLQSPVAQHLKGIYTAKDLLHYDLPVLTEDYVGGPTGIADVDSTTSGIKKLEEIIASRARAVRGENANIQQPNLPNVRQGIYFPTNTGMAPTVGSPFQQQAPMLQNPTLPIGMQQQVPFPGAAQPISAGQVPLSRGR